MYERFEISYRQRTAACGTLPVSPVTEEVVSVIPDGDIARRRMGCRLRLRNDAVARRLFIGKGEAEQFGLAPHRTDENRAEGGSVAEAPAGRHSHTW